MSEAVQDAGYDAAAVEPTIGLDDLPPPPGPKPTRETEALAAHDHSSLPTFDN